MVFFRRLVISAVLVGVAIPIYSLRELPRAAATEPTGPDAAVAVKVRFISVSEAWWEGITHTRQSGYVSYFPTFPDLGIKFADLKDGEHKRPVALLNEKQTFLLMEAVQGDRQNEILLAPKLTVGNCQQATLSIAGDGEVARGKFLPWDQDPARSKGGAERGVAGVQLTVRAALGDANADHVAFQARFIKADRPYLSFAGQPKESRFLGDPVNVSLSVPKQGAALVGAWKIVHEVDRVTGPAYLKKITPMFNKVIHERQVDVILILVTARATRVGDELSEALRLNASPKHR